MATANDGERTGLSREQLDGVDHRNMSKAEALFMVGRKIGMFGHKRGQLTKRDLNSVYWYLTGSQIAPPIDFGTERSPTVGEMRRKIAVEAGFPYTREIVDESGVSNGPGHVHVDRHERTYEVGAAEGTKKIVVGGGTARPFRLRELQALVRVLRETDDQREMTNRP